MESGSGLKINFPVQESERYLQLNAPQLCVDDDDYEKAKRIVDEAPSDKYMPVWKSDSCSEVIGDIHRMLELWKKPIFVIMDILCNSSTSNGAEELQRQNI